MKLIKAFATASLLTGLATAVAAGEGHHVKKTSGQASGEQQEWGVAGERKAARRTIEVRMTDRMRFEPAAIRVNQGDTVRFVVKNAGKVLHEMVIGTKAKLDEHAALMAKFPKMEHDEPYMAHVRPGRTGEIVWTFNRPGEFNFACLIQGHYQAGMVGKITVAEVRGGAPGKSHKH